MESLEDVELANQKPLSGVSFQLYSSRKFAPITETIGMLSDLGYRQAEGYAGLYDQAEMLRGALETAGMTMPTGHFPLSLLEADPGKVVEIAGFLGISTVFCPSLGASAHPTDAGGWHAFGVRLGRIGARLADADLRFGWHNHDYEFQPLPDGRLPLDQIFEAAPGLGWQFDVAWAVVGGQDPGKLISRHADRILSAHVKDIAPAGTNLDQDGWIDVGKGVLDWPTLEQDLRSVGCNHFVIEHDNPADDLAFARASFSTLRGY